MATEGRVKGRPGSRPMTKGRGWMVRRRRLPLRARFSRTQWASGEAGAAAGFRYRAWFTSRFTYHQVLYFARGPPSLPLSRAAASLQDPPGHQLRSRGPRGSRINFLAPQARPGQAALADTASSGSQEVPEGAGLY